MMKGLSINTTGAVGPLPYKTVLKQFEYGQKNCSCLD